MITLPYLNVVREEADMVYDQIQKHKRYILKFNPNPAQAELVAQEILIKILETNRRYVDNTPYIKKLARVLSYSAGQKSIPEYASEVTNEKGDTSGAFMSLKEVIDESEIEDRGRLTVALRHLYLKHPKDFAKLEMIYSDDIIKLDDKDSLKSIRVRNEELYHDVKQLVTDYGISVFAALQDFLKDLPNLVNTEINVTTKPLVFKPVEKCQQVLEKLNGKTNVFTTSDNVVVPICPTTYLSDENPDYVKWKEGSSNRIQRIDITPFMEYMYDQVFVPQGVETKHIIWCDSSYRVTTPSGAYFIDENLDHFINSCRIELIAAILKASSAQVVAISPDNVYIKGRKVEHLKANIFGKTLILPVTKMGG